MSSNQYHEPANELPNKTRTFARMITSLQEEAEAIGWYEQRIAIEDDREAVSIMEDAQKEEMKHFAMDLEFLIRKKPDWQTILKSVLFTKGSIVEAAKKGEEKVE